MGVVDAFAKSWLPANLSAERVSIDTVLWNTLTVSVDRSSPIHRVQPEQSVPRVKAALEMISREDPRSLLSFSRDLKNALIDRTAKARDQLQGKLVSEGMSDEFAKYRAKDLLAEALYGGRVIFVEGSEANRSEAQRLYREALQEATAQAMGNKAFAGKVYMDLGADLLVPRKERKKIHELFDKMPAVLAAIPHTPAVWKTLGTFMEEQFMSRIAGSKDKLLKAKK